MDEDDAVEDEEELEAWEEEQRCIQNDNCNGEELTKFEPLDEVLLDKVRRARVREVEMR